jgi:deoxycytidylate deaminase
MVHAEMEALLACARSGVSPVNGTVHCTTFPCHNCAKHIIAAGIKRVVFIEPYPKSKALEFHQEAVTLDKSDGENKVIFEPFTGIGPRKFFDLFSMNMSSGYPLSRKEKGKNAVWTRKNAVFRLPTASISYFELEKLTANILTKVME